MIEEVTAPCRDRILLLYGESTVTKNTFRTALRDTIPVLTGYLVLGMGFGIIMDANGYGLIWTAAMSIFVFAGSMQYAAIGLMTGGASLLTVALTTFAVNCRHLFYGISMIDKYKNAGKFKPYMIFALTDETYSLVCSTDKGSDYCFCVSLLDQCYWVLGSILGSILGSSIDFNSAGIDFALTALFITIFVDQWLNSKEHFSAVAGVGISLVSLLIFGAQSFLIPSMLGITVVLLLRMRKEVGHVRS